MEPAPANSRYLVTGASGFIGGAVCRLLLESGAEVHAVARTKTTFEYGDWKYWNVDLTDDQAVTKLFASVAPRFVLHLAGCTIGKREIEWIKPTLHANLLTSVNVLTAASASRVEKTVLAGSLEEPDLRDPEAVASSPYAASKAAASSYARMFHALYSLQSAVARIFMVYGPRQRELAKLIPYVCMCALRNERPRLAAGDRLVDWVYVDDVARGLIQLLHAGPVDGSHVDLGSGVLTTTGDIARKICQLAPTNVEPELGAMPDRALEQVRVADVAATKSMINWSPQVDLRTGLKNTLEWFGNSEQK